MQCVDGFDARLRALRAAERMAKVMGKNPASVVVDHGSCPVCGWTPCMACRAGLDWAHDHVRWCVAPRKIVVSRDAPLLETNGSHPGRVAPAVLDVLERDRMLRGRVFDPHAILLALEGRCMANPPIDDLLRAAQSAGLGVCLLYTSPSPRD